jgi:hypothetical protein
MFLDEKIFTTLLHPLYSLDIAPTNFFLFDAINTRLQECHRIISESVQLDVDEILALISPSELLAVLGEWRKRLERVITIHREYA